MNRLTILKFVAVAIAVASATTADAKLRHYSNSRVSIGEVTAEDAQNIKERDKDTVTTLKIYGPFGEWATGGRISFGDQESIYAQNVMVGELGTEDSDKLWLHGKRGIYYTSQYMAQDTIFYFDIDSINPHFHFNCDVHADGIFVASDQRFKDNVSPLNSSLSSLRNISPVSYRLKPHFTDKGATRGVTSEKETRDRQRATQYYNNLNNDSLRYGFIAQEIIKIYPELVRSDGSGYMYVDYIGMIPILVNAINELQNKIDAMESGEIKKTKDTHFGGVNGVDGLETDAVVASLCQNAPNPFNAETVIGYSLPETVISAQIYIYNMQGRQISKYELSERGNGSITISASEFEAGMYIYTLIADGKEIDTKRMILTE